MIDIHAHTSNHILHGLHTKHATISELEIMAIKYNIEKIYLMATYFPLKGTGVKNKDLLSRIKDHHLFGCFGSINMETMAEFKELERDILMNIILGITGSVATTLTPKLYDQLVAAGHDVKIVATTPALYFIPSTFTQEIFKDKDEWPLGGYHKNDPVKHIEFRTWANLLLIAPLTANTLAKISTGIADNFLCCIALAWPLNKPAIYAPAMNTEMWNNPITQAHIHKFRRYYRSVSVIDPISKKLACGDTGIGAMADIQTIMKQVQLVSMLGIDANLYPPRPMNNLERRIDDLFERP